MEVQRADNPGRRIHPFVFLKQWETGVVAGGWIEAPPAATKKHKLQLEALGWLSATTPIRPVVPSSKQPKTTDDTASGSKSHQPAEPERYSTVSNRLLPLTDTATAALLHLERFGFEFQNDILSDAELSSDLHQLLTDLKTSAVKFVAVHLNGCSVSPNNKRVQTPQQLRFVDLFAGIGGFRIGLEAIGARCVWSCDIDKWARTTYGLNFGKLPVGTDITRTPGYNVPDHDILVGGFPCQPFSSVGRRLGLKDGKNGNLFLHICRLLRERRPLSFILENVKGILSSENGSTLKIVLKELDAAGYYVHYDVLEASDILPQRRARVFFVGFRKDVTNANRFSFPVLPKLGRAVSDVLEPEDMVDSRHRLSTHQWNKVKSQPYYQKHPGARLVDISSPASTLQSNYKSGYLLYSQFVGRPGSEDSPPRFYTPRECARLQGFPESFILPVGKEEGRWYRQIGNAVPPPLVAAVAYNVASVINDTPIGGEGSICDPLVQLLNFSSPGADILTEKLEGLQAKKSKVV